MSAMEKSVLPLRVAKRLSTSIPEREYALFSRRSRIFTRCVLSARSRPRFLKKRIVAAVVYRYSP